MSGERIIPLISPINESVRDWMERWRIRRLREKEKKLFEQALFTIQAIQFSAKDLLEPLPEIKPVGDLELKKILFDRAAERFIPIGDEKPEETDMLRRVFSLGCIQTLKDDGSLRPVAQEIGVSWEKCIFLFASSQETYYLNALKDFTEDLR